jgi:hypothetical protein
MGYAVEYDTREPLKHNEEGIVIRVILRTLQNDVRLNAKIDTGAEYCVFAREHAENMGLDVESGHPLRLATLTGHTVAYGHEVTMIAMELELTGICYFFENPTIRRSFLGRNGWLNKVRLGIDDTSPSGVLYAGRPV